MTKVGQFSLTFYRYRQSFALATARAVVKLNVLVEYGLPFVDDGARGKVIFDVRERALFFGGATLFFSVLGKVLSLE
jgi:hypothetical protein